MAERRFPTRLMEEQYQTQKLKEKVVGSTAFGILCAAIYWLATSPVGKEVGRLITTVPDK